MSQCHRIKGGTTDKAFQEPGFLWETGAPFWHRFGVFQFQKLLNEQELTLHAEGKGKKITKNITGLL